MRTICRLNTGGAGNCIMAGVRYVIKVADLGQPVVCRVRKLNKYVWSTKAVAGIALRNQNR